MVFEGLAGFKNDDIHHLHICEDAPETTSYVLGSAHALVRLDDGEVVGDPMEQATLKQLIGMLVLMILLKEKVKRVKANQKK